MNLSENGLQIYKLYFLTRKINLKYFLTLILPLLHILLMNLQTFKLTLIRLRVQIYNPS